MKRVMAILSVASLILSFSLLNAVSYSTTFNEMDLSIVKDSTNTYDLVTMEGLQLTEDVGAPQLPVQYVKLIIPANMKVDDLVITVNTQRQSGDYYVYPTQEPVILSETWIPGPFVEPDSVIYNTNALYPAQVAEAVGDGFFDGCAHIVTLAIYPMRFNPVDESLVLYTSISIDLSLTSASTNAVYPQIRSARMQTLTSDALSSLVENTQDISLYYSNPQIDDTAIDYVIVSPAGLASSLDDFVQWKRLKGYSVEVKTIEDILVQYPNGDQIGVLGINDDAGSIRQYLYEMYRDYGLCYVLLVGDDTGFPIRYGWASRSSQSIHYNLPSDLYFGEFNGNWNLNGNERYGEPYFNDNGVEYGDNPDYSYDICVGRLLVSADVIGCTMIDNWLDKLLIYEMNPGYGDNEYIVHSVFTSSDGCVGEEGITNSINTLNTNGFTIEHLEEYPVIGDLGIPTGSQVVSAVNEGTGILCLNNHGGVKTAAVATTDNNDYPKYGLRSLDQYESPPNYNEESGNGFDNFLENGKYHFVYSTCCDVAGYDREDETGVTYISMARAYTVSAEVYHKGGPAFLGNTRYGIMGTSHDLEEYFFDDLFTCDYKNIGYINRSSLELEDSHYLTYSMNLFGDPEMEIWTDYPQDFTVAHDIVNSTFTVTHNGSPVEGATVAFAETSSGTYTYATTNASGVVTYTSDFEDICVTKHNFLPYTKRIGGANEVISTATDLKWDMIIPAGRTVTLNSTISLESFAGRNAKIVVEDGATLILGSSCIIVGNEETFEPDATSDIQIEIPGNCVEVYGTLQIGDASFSPTGDWDGIVMEDATVTCGEAIFLNTPVYMETSTFDATGGFFSNSPVEIDHSTFEASEAYFSDSALEVSTSDITLDECELYDSPIDAFHANELGTARQVTLTDCDIENTTGYTAVFLSGYPKFSISGNTIEDDYLTLRIEESGSGSPHLIEDNTIINCPGTAIVLYHSYADIEGHNSIYDNLCGIVALNNSNWKLVGDKDYPIQRIHDNSHEEIIFTVDSTPDANGFACNEISDDDTNHTYPLIRCTGIPASLIDVSGNYWGTNFNAAYDFDPIGYFTYLPIWNPGIPKSSSTGDAATLYSTATESEVSGDYTTAETTYQSVISTYPETEYATLSAKALLSLETDLGNDYTTLQTYYETVETSNPGSNLAKTCDYLANYCNIKMLDYATAITWFEDVIQNPPTEEDSVFAVIDAGYTYLLMEDGSRQAFTGKIAELKPASKAEFEAKKAELLGMFWNDSEEADNVPSVPVLSMNYPNPFNPTTTICFSIPEASKVEMDIYNIKGQKVKRLVNDDYPRGNHKVQWQGVNETGHQVSSGVYFYRLKVNGKSIGVKKMLMLK